MTSTYFEMAYGPDYVRRNPAYKWRSFLRELLRFRKGGDLLEAGCGFGLFLREARAHFVCVTTAILVIAEKALSPPVGEPAAGS